MHSLLSFQRRRVMIAHPRQAIRNQGVHVAEGVRDSTEMAAVMNQRVRKNAAMAELRVLKAFGG